MSKEIFSSRYSVGKQPAWKLIGKNFDKEITAVEGLNESRLNFKIEKTPLYSYYKGEYIKNPKCVSLIRESLERDPQPRTLGIVSKNYGLFQNEEIAEIIDATIPQWNIESIGATKNLGTIFYVAKIDELEIKGDLIHEYFIINDIRDGKNSLSLNYVPMRVTSKTSLILSGEQRLSLRHTENIKKDAPEALKIFRDLQTMRSTGISSLKEIANKFIDKSEVEEIVDHAYPIPKQPSKSIMYSTSAASGTQGDNLESADKLWKSACDKARMCRETAKLIFKRFNEEQPTLKNTAWALYNSIVELEDYRVGKNDKQACESALFGERAKNKMRAFKKSLEIARR
jgi:hypothetical protein